MTGLGKSHAGNVNSNIAKQWHRLDHAVKEQYLEAAKIEKAQAQLDEMIVEDEFTDPHSHNSSPTQTDTVQDENTPPVDYMNLEDDFENSDTQNM